jgi:4-nitrophenyl phosphatase
MVSTPSIKQSRLEDIVEKYQYFIFDCDGVLFHSGDEIGQAFAALKYIKHHPSKSKDVFFFTNSTSRTRETLLKKFQEEHNYFESSVENIYTAGYLTARYCKDKLIPSKKAEKPALFTDMEPSVFVIGEQGLKDELRNFGVSVSNYEAEVYP